jgi:hypothetical protein
MKELVSQMFSFILLPRYESRWRYLIGSYDLEM